MEAVTFPGQCLKRRYLYVTMIVLLHTHVVSLATLEATSELVGYVWMSAQAMGAYWN